MDSVSMKSDSISDLKSVGNCETINESVDNIGDNVPPYIPPLDIHPPKTSAHMPFVYFVVAENKMPIQVSLLEGTSKPCNHAIKTRKQFVNDKKKLARYQDELKKHIQQQNSYLGLSIGSMKDANGHVSTSITDNIYPNYKIPNSGKRRVKSEFTKQTRFSGLGEYEECMESASVDNVKKANSIINLELSISDGKNKPIRIPSTADSPSTELEQQKRVQFSECSFYKDFPLPKRSSSKASKASTTPKRILSRCSNYSDSERTLSPEKQLASNAILSSRSQPGSYKHEMSLPKIDLVSDMYDDVIIKAIDAYMRSRNISAKRRPEMERQLISRLAMNRKYQMEVDAKIRESSATTTRSRVPVDADMPSLEHEDEKPHKPVPLKQTPFHMVAPGSQITKQCT